MFVCMPILCTNMHQYLTFMKMVVFNSYFVRLWNSLASVKLLLLVVHFLFLKCCQSRTLLCYDIVRSFGISFWLYKPTPCCIALAYRRCYTMTYIAIQNKYYAHKVNPMVIDGKRFLMATVQDGHTHTYYYDPELSSYIPVICK